MLFDNIESIKYPSKSTVYNLGMYTFSEIASNNDGWDEYEYLLLNTLEVEIDKQHAYLLLYISNKLAVLVPSILEVLSI